MTFLRIVIPLYLLFEHDLFGKPVPTFPDHALAVPAGSEVDIEHQHYATNSLYALKHIGPRQRSHPEVIERSVP
jgi:hypothetical protein